MILPANQEMVLPQIQGNAIELAAEIELKDAPMLELNVLRSPNKEEYTRIMFYRNRGYDLRRAGGKIQASRVSIDTSLSSTLPRALSRAPETADFRLKPNQNLQLRVFVDRSVVEVFVNDNQCVAVRTYPDRSDSTLVSLRSQGTSTRLISLDCWQMQNIYESSVQ